MVVGIRGERSNVHAKQIRMPQNPALHAQRSECNNVVNQCNKKKPKQNKIKQKDLVLNLTPENRL